LLPNKGLIFYDNLGLNCDIYSDSEALQIVWPIVFNIVPMIIGISLSTYSYGRIIAYLKRFGGDYNISIKRFIAYPLSLVIVWLPITLFRIVYFSIEAYPFTWDAIGIVFARSSGLINAVMYGWDRKRLTEEKYNDGGRERSHTGLSDEIDLTETSFYQMETDLMRKSSIYKL